MTDQARPYSSPLRESQAQRTRELILDALTGLLSELPADEVRTREIAERAGVSQPTVYRHFPDRTALLEGLSERIEAMANAAGDGGAPETLDALSARAGRALLVTEANAVQATAEAILNADPRRLSRASRARSEELRRIVADELPEYDDRTQLHITALLRNIYSVQTWLRMREEFGIPGTESGPTLTWAFDVLVREMKAGKFPTAPPATS